MSWDWVCGSAWRTGISQSLLRVSQVTSELWALYHDNPDSQVGALKQEQKQACLFIRAEEAEIALGCPPVGW